MIIFSIFLYVVSQTAIYASPIASDPLLNSTDIRDLSSALVADDVPCNCPQLRSIWDILWSCLATIFACTWVSVHPNSPGPQDGRMRIILTRVELMIWAMLIPEIIIYWAFKQWLGARQLAARFKEFGWSNVHGHFLQMGGFILVDGDKDMGVIYPRVFYDLLQEGKIRFPRVSEDEINALSKGDGFSKLIVVGQTSWFVAQCISRAVQGLVITELELVTVSFAFLNVLLYFLWWNKPLNSSFIVRVPICSDLVPIIFLPLDGHDDDDTTINFLYSPFTVQSSVHSQNYTPRRSDASVDMHEAEPSLDGLNLHSISQDRSSNALQDSTEKCQSLDPHNSVEVHHSGTEHSSMVPCECELSIEPGTEISNSPNYPSSTHASVVHQNHVSKGSDASADKGTANSSLDDLDPHSTPQDRSSNILQDSLTEQFKREDSHHSVDDHDLETGRSSMIGYEPSIDLGHVRCSSPNQASPAAVANRPVVHTRKSRTTFRSLCIPWYLLYGITRWIMKRIGHMRSYNTSTHSHTTGLKRIHIFYAFASVNKHATEKATNIFRSAAIACIGAVFGAIHCAGWNFVFPSRTQMLIWRISSAFIFAYPSIIGLTMLITIMWAKAYFRSLDGSVHSGKAERKKLMVIVYVLHNLFKCLPIYLLARMVLLIEAFIALRDLPMEAFVQVEWMRFLPHI